eukprot:513149-Amphidinium_carterae.1
MGHIAKECGTPARINAVADQGEEQGATGSTGAIGAVYINSLGSMQEDLDGQIGSIRVGVDSGAAASVISPGAAKGTIYKDDSTGKFYTTATGERVEDKGRQHVEGKVGDKLFGIKFRVVDGIRKPLLSVAEAVDAGYKIVFDKVDGEDNSFFIHKATGEKIKMQRTAKVYDISLVQDHPFHR